MIHWQSHHNHQKLVAIVLLMVLVSVFLLLYDYRRFAILTNLDDDESLIRNKIIPQSNKNKTTPTIVLLLRVIGNAVPPCLEQQTVVNNLNFTLMNEPAHTNVYKHWVLNRLVDSTMEEQVIGLLEAHRANYTRIPFVPREYAKISYNFDLWKEPPDVIHTMRYHTGKLTDTEFESIQYAMTLNKSLYMTHPNYTHMLEIIGIQAYLDAKWILPWDGYCLVHGMETLLGRLNNATTLLFTANNTNYFYTQVSSSTVVVTNGKILDPQPETITSEPQLVLDRSALAPAALPLLQDELWNKFEMTQCLLKVPDPGNLYEKESTQSIWKDAPQANWVSQLSSGKTDLDLNVVARGKSRESRLEFFSNLDVRVARELYHFNASTLLYYDESALQRDRDLFQNNSSKNSRIRLVTERLLQVAKDALTVGPWSVTDKPQDSVAPSKDPHDYYHPAPYFWPVRFENGTIDEKAKFVRRDGKRVPGTVLFDSLSHRFDRTRLKAMMFNTTVLALSYYITGEQEYGTVAARNIRHWFLNNDTRMNPNLRYAQVAQGHDNNHGRPQGIIEMKDLHFVLDAVRILEKGGFLSDPEQAALRDWFREYMKWLETSNQGLKEYTAPNNHGIYYDIQFVAVAAYVNDTSKMLRCVDRSVSRLHQQIMPNGSMHHEMARPICEHYQMFTLFGWATLARMGEVVGRELWKAFPDKNGISALCRAANFSIPFFWDRKICKPKAPVDDVQRWWPLLLDATYHCPSLRGKATHWPEWFPRDAKKPPFSAYEMPVRLSNVSPFWNLGLLHAEPEQKQPIQSPP